MALKDSAFNVDSAITREGHRGMSFENAFGGILSFMRRTYTKDLSGVDLAITGIPFDQAVTNRPGSRFGPRAIREASTLQPCDPPFGWDINPLADFDVVDYGDLAFDYANVAAFPERLTDHIRVILKEGVGTLSFGGDHYITFPILRAYAEKYGPMALVHFDAHSDTWPDDDMTRIDHGTMFYKAVKEGLILPEKSVQIGIRTQNDYDAGVHVIDAPRVHGQTPSATAAQVKEIVGNHPVYLTFDIDCLDPAFAPGTGTPVWGGLSSAQAAAILRDIRGINMVGGDVVEVSPQYDVSGATAVAGAHAAMELMCLYCWNLRAQKVS
ncbi:MAG: agmatinase [Planktomarina sp.]|jgi:agmatinase|nr:agmatinase [Planktomarina sp.]MDT2057374.1 agmatinase [Planktomarina sp.]MDT2072339.1 agmatinase [Planktomarina sp.]MDT2077383.1 agmatinase [Planktomarina sp.]|tara:strand:+ start:4183 stop:5157 length:975 start_codon:yes stop_codon:yes gene_type:complete